MERTVPSGRESAASTALRARIEDLARRRMALPLSDSSARTAELWSDEAQLWDQLLDDPTVPATRELHYAAQLAHSRAALYRGEAAAMAGRAEP